jgi:hypothetical protein
MMAKKWLVLVIVMAGLLLAGCGDNAVAMPTGLFMPQADLNPAALCAIEITNVEVVKPPNNPNRSALIVEGTVGEYCGQMEIKMSPINNTDEVHIIMVAEPPKDPPASNELQSRKPVYINMTLDTLPTGRYKLFINGKSYDTFSTP